MTELKKITLTLDGNRKIGHCLIKNTSSYQNQIVSKKSNIYQPANREMTIAVIKLIGEAKEVICISSFIIQDSEIIAEIEKAANRGVKVYLLTAAEKQVDSPYEDDNANLKDRKEASRDLLIRLGKKALIKTSQHLHSKFILIDPRNFRKASFSLTTLRSEL